jgi:Jacalin-like lectin domain
MAQNWKIGAIGGTGGGSFDDGPISSPLETIGIHAGSYVDALVLTYGNTQMIHGGGGGQANNSFTLNNGEFITMLVGRAGDYIDQLQIVTNQRSYGPFGGSGGNPFVIQLPPNWGVVKFWGQSGSYLDALGIYIQPT